jgi:hypothetical protein
MERNKIYIKMLFCKNPKLESLVNIDSYSKNMSLIEINDSVKKILISNKIDTQQLSSVNINDLYFILNLKKMKIKN